MARINNLSDFLTDVASAIKTKKGSETAIPAANFDTEILALPAQGTYQQKSVTISANGTTTFEPDQGYDAMDQVTIEVNVPTGGEDLENVIAEQENIIANLSNIVNTKAGTLYHVPDGVKFCSSTFTSIPSDIDFSDVTDMTNMFSNCINLTTVSNLNVSNATTMANMFYNCNNLTSVSNLNASNTTSMASMFRDCDNLTTVPNLNTSNVTSMVGMFMYCYNLTTVSNLNVSNVTNMTNMFYGCINLISVPNFDTTNVTSMSNMFSQCTNLTNVPEFDTSNVIGMFLVGSGMGGMFTQCNNLSDASIQNIINMCLNSNTTTASFKNLNRYNSYSPLYRTNITSDRYSNRLEELTAAGWTY